MGVTSFRLLGQVTISGGRLVAFKRKFQTDPPKPAEAKPSFRKVSLPPAKLCMLFPAHFWVREFWPQIYYLSQALSLSS